MRGSTHSFAKKWFMAVAVAVMLFCSFTALAEDNFVVRDVKIAGDGATATVARDVAVNTGMVQGLRTLITRFSSEAAATSAEIDGKTINRLVESYEVQDEHISPAHYEALMHIKFNKSLTRQYLDQKGLVAKAANGKDAHLGLTQLFVVQANSPQRWADIRKRLKEMASISTLEIKEITSQQIVVNVIYKGQLEALQADLQKHGFLISPRRGIPLLQLVG